MICGCINKHALAMGHTSKQCSYVVMQLRKLTCIYYEPKQQAMQLCCYAAAELDKHAYIMDQSSKQCSYVAMQLWKLRCIFHEPKWQTMQLCCHAAAELKKHAYMRPNFRKSVPMSHFMPQIFITKMRNGNFQSPLQHCNL